ncbi:hypothetical protein Sru01_27600 [Sphaerisporangium rufum]|uniref:non-specific serine/threonine protein kinase n=1 Tax=Sphaerisporangium rufum TaxID=1381558 RepID=A0A919R1T5_9ACTN|nr:serine/threonine-protein kinase [Sphaerisporangium rufum]GII77778.1 hypothetical protein Sru01_27600 [Sphaerisporangium rufum]
MPEQQTRLLAARYELIAPLGRGTMGTVWRAHDRLLGRDVAIKEIRQDPGLRPDQRGELRERMIREGRAAAKISHPSVATVHDAILVDGSPWIVMELVEGRSLEQVIDEEGPLPPRLVAEIGVDLLDALREAHRRGVLHRDVKPANVLLTDGGRVVLTDFGIAKAEGDSTITKTGMVIGSPGYTAPERARGDHTGPESDLWSLGATLYFAVEGRPAYERRSVSETLAALMTEQADPPTQAGPLRPVLEALLEKDHTRRVPHDRALALLRAVAGTPSGSPVPPPAGPAPAGPHRPSPGPAATRPPADPPTRPGAAAARPGGSTAAGQPGGRPETARPPARPGGPPPGGPGQTGARPAGVPEGTGAAASSGLDPARSPAPGGIDDDEPDGVDPNQTMVIIRPKGGLAIPAGGTPEATGPGRAGAATGAGARPATPAAPARPATPGGPGRSGSPGAPGAPGAPGGSGSPGGSGGSAPSGPAADGELPDQDRATTVVRRPAHGMPTGTALRSGPGLPPAPPAAPGSRPAPGPGPASGPGGFAPGGTPPPGTGPATASAPDSAAGPAATPGSTPPWTGPGSAAAAEHRADPAEPATTASPDGPAAPAGSRGLGTDLFALQGAEPARSGSSPVGMIILLTVALIGLLAIVLLIFAAISG